MAGGVLATVRETISAGQVFAEPVQRGGTTLIGVARVYGGGGGEQPADGSTAGGLGMAVAPVGAYVIRDGRVRWIPAVDVNQIIVVGAVITVLLLVRGARRRKAARQAQQEG